MVKKKKKWMQKAVKRPGALTRKAKAAGMSISEYCSQPGISTQSKRQCALAKTFAKYRPKKKKKK